MHVDAVLLLQLRAHFRLDAFTFLFQVLLAHAVYHLVEAQTPVLVLSDAFDDGVSCFSFGRLKGKGSGYFTFLQVKGDISEVGRLASEVANNCAFMRTTINTVQPTTDRKSVV